MKLGILGGTFNPVHVGHMVLAQECWYRLMLDKVMFVPAYCPPHKRIEGDVPAADRLSMLRLALKGESRFDISTYELDAGGTSFSIDTVKYFLSGMSEGDELFFLTGADSADTLESWKEIDLLLELTTFVVATRPPWKLPGKFTSRIRPLDIPGLDVSSSMIRQRIRKRQPIDYLVDPRVVEYIRNKGLYR